MERWEIDYRTELEATIPYGFYLLDDGTNGWVMGTGKLGYINYLVEIRRKEYGIEEVIKNAIQKGESFNLPAATEQDFINTMKEIQKNETNNKNTPD